MVYPEIVLSDIEFLIMLDFFSSTRNYTHTNQQLLFSRHWKTTARQFGCFAVPTLKMARI